MEKDHVNYHKIAKLLSFGLFLFTWQLISLPALASDSAKMVREIQKNVSSIQRKITTQPKNAETKLAETMTLFKALESTDPTNRNISRLKKKLEKLDKKLAKRLRRSVKPANSSTTLRPVHKPKQSTKNSSSSSKTLTTGKGEKLPSSVVSRMKKIDKNLAKINKSLDSNSLQRAKLNFNKVNKILKEIDSRYGKKISTGHPDMVALKERITTVNTRLQRMINKDMESTNSELKAKQDNKALAETWIKNMSTFVSRDSDKRLIVLLHKLSGDAVAKNKANYNEASNLFKKYQAIEFPLGKPMG